MGNNISVASSSKMARLHKAQQGVSVNSLGSVSSEQQGFRCRRNIITAIQHLEAANWYLNSPSNSNDWNAQWREDESEVLREGRPVDESVSGRRSVRRTSSYGSFRSSASGRSRSTGSLRRGASRHYSAASEHARLGRRHHRAARRSSAGGRSSYHYTEARRHRRTARAHSRAGRRYQSRAAARDAAGGCLCC